MFAVVKKNVPLFNCDNIADVYQRPSCFCSQYLIREVETVLIPGTSVEILSEEGNVLKVSVPKYPSSNSLYVDKRFLTRVNHLPPENKDVPLTKREILTRLEEFPRCHYIWGGTVPEGVPSWSQLYPPSKPFTPYQYLHWHLKGVDCSGLLYNVTDGLLPRNTSDMYNIGIQVHSLRPLDIVLFPGHVLVVLEGDRIMECRQFDGLVISPLARRLQELDKQDLTYIRWI